MKLHSDEKNIAHHQWPIRVYFEDTDAAGIVFYPNYLRYTERARTEFLRACGLYHSTFVTKKKQSFVVRRCSIEYLKSAVLDDQLIIYTSVIKIGHASLALQQNIYRNQDLIVSTHIDLVFVDLITSRPLKIDEDLKTKIKLYKQ